MNNEIKAIVITGATGVLGNLAAKTFAERGHNLALLNRDQDKLDSLTRDLNLPADRLYTQIIDLLDGNALHDSAQKVSSKFGNIHTLIHLVGGWVGGKTIPESEASDLEFMLNFKRYPKMHLFSAGCTQIHSCLDSKARLPQDTKRIIMMKI